MRTFRYASAMVSKTMGAVSMVFITMLVLFLLNGCSVDSNGGTVPPPSGNTGGGSSGGASNSPGTDTGSGGGATDGGTNTGTGGTGGTGTGGSGTGGTGDTGGSSGGGTAPGTLGTLASLYTAQNERLNINNCNMLANASVNFSQVVFRLIGQAGNDINAVITFTPDSQYLAQFDQVVLTLQGAFTAQDTILGSFSAVSTLNGLLIDRTQGTFDIAVFPDATLAISFVEDSNAQACHVSGGISLRETADTGTGTGTGGTGGSGGDTGGSTGGSTGGGTGGTGGSGDTVTAGLVIAHGQFGSLQMQSQEFPEDNGTFEMTTVQFVNIPGNEMFAWTNDQQATINVYFGLDNSNTTLDSPNSREYLCDCFPTVDLINNQVFFDNVVLMKTSSPTGSIIINGTLTFPQAN